MVRNMITIKKKELEEFMRLKGLNYTSLAKVLGYSKSTVSKIVNNKLMPSGKFIAQLKRASGMPVEYFFDFGLNFSQSHSE